MLWSFVSSADQSVCRFADVPEFCYLYILIPEGLYWIYDIHLALH